MFDFLRQRSVRQKLLLMVFAVNLCTLVSAGIALLYDDWRDTRARTAAELAAIANLVGAGSVAALEFSDVQVATDDLAQLRSAPQILAAAIYRANGKVFASYARGTGAAPALPAQPGPAGFRFDSTTLEMVAPITSGREVLGTVYLRQHYDFSQWLRDYLLILGSVLLASLALGLLMTSRLQRWISGPILAVRDVARQVMEQRSYQLRPPISSGDEVGQVADAFNGMLQSLEHEIGERSAAELAVRSLNVDLEQRVLARTAELQIANQSLVVRTEEAESANRAKADFLANMSHEIRTPMNGILGLAYLLDRRQLDPEAADMVRKIRNAGRSLQAIINDILDFSKIEAGRLDIEHAPFRLVDVIDNLAGIMSASVGDKEIELTIAPPPVIGGALKGDALRLEQVLINLTGNAIKFTERGAITVDIDLMAQDEKTVSLRFAVTDSGIGIALDQQAQIFSAFSQADVSTTRHFGGTGLGLTICRHLVHNMGGEIGVISAPGRGSQFWFTIPFEWDAMDDYAQPELARLDVVVADDNELARDTLVRTARSLGWSASAVDCGEAVIEKVSARHARRGKYDVLLIDWKMPGMDGLAVAAQLRQALREHVPPIVLMVSAYARDQLDRHADMTLIDGVLNKPVTSSMLYNAVAAAIARRGNGPGLPPRAKVVAGGRRLPGLRVLVVDDSEINREVARRILNGDGAEVTLACDGAGAVAWLRAYPGAVDIVLMDVQMPGMDGYETTRALRTLPGYEAIPVIALTAGAFKAQQEAARNAGMNAFVAKPFNVDELMANIQQLTHWEAEAEAADGAAATGAAAPPGAGAVGLPGIDLAKGMETWRDMAAYSKYLRKFAIDYGNCIAQLGELYRAGDAAAAAAYVHKLKGGAGNLALTDVAREAAVMEAVQHSGTDLTEAIDALEAALAVALASIATLAEADTYAAAVTAPLAAAQGDLADHGLAAELLAALDTDTPDLANRLLDRLAPSAGAAAASRIRNAIDNFDFRAAEALVRALPPSQPSGEQ
jgi:signal transduction histidine kinase/CheY-like chemotaxis protein/HPt (histidine-containing phosphotransfer) domain-containing protein